LRNPRLPAKFDVMDVRKEKGGVREGENLPLKKQAQNLRSLGKSTPTATHLTRKKGGEGNRERRRTFSLGKRRTLASRCDAKTAKRKPRVQVRKTW